MNQKSQMRRSLFSILAISAGVGFGVAIFFFVAYFLVALLFGGFGIDAFSVFFSIALYVLDLPSGGSLQPVALFWGVIAALVTFGVLAVRNVDTGRTQTGK
ncbi:MAG TPA: hypothetical protein DDX06_03300 [Curvibacter sp.]|nr:hypothetical protein [Curvibacter sp.]